ncbi:hypothetical protein E4U58_003002 [Claviceps cyperi]|nr:hypothetical protein E4U58_003002 [Claviceps cyperi]
MESPHEHQQNLLLSRIINNVEKLNEAVVVMNKSLQDINIQNMNVELVAQMFKNYQSNVLFHLEVPVMTTKLRPTNESPFHHEISAMDWTFNALCIFKAANRTRNSPHPTAYLPWEFILSMIALLKAW